MMKPEVNRLGRAKLASEWMESGDRLLDIGCSEGALVSLVWPKCHMALGIDVDIENLKKARDKCPQVEFQMGSAEQLPFDNGVFSVITMMDVLEHVPHPKAALQEVDRVLQPGGHLILSVPHKGTFGFVDAQNSYLFAAGRKVIKNKEDKMLFHKHYEMNEISTLLGPSYEIMRIHNGGFLIFPLCGYVTMFTDSMPVPRFSIFVRKLEDIDFRHDYGSRSWHLMMEFKKRRTDEV